MFTSQKSRRTVLWSLAVPVLLAPLMSTAALADPAEERWRHEHEEWREHQWRAEEHAERRARAEAEMREHAAMFHRERRWVGPGYYYDGHSYVYLNDPPPPYFWGPPAVAVPAPSVDIVVPLRLRF